MKIGDLIFEHDHNTGTISDIGIVTELNVEMWDLEGQEEGRNMCFWFMTNEYQSLAYPIDVNERFRGNRYSFEVIET